MRVGGAKSGTDTRNKWETRGSAIVWLQHVSPRSYVRNLMSNVSTAGWWARYGSTIPDSQHSRGRERKIVKQMMLFFFNFNFFENFTHEHTVFTPFPPLPLFFQHFPLEWALRVKPLKKKSKAPRPQCSGGRSRRNIHRFKSNQISTVSLSLPRARKPRFQYRGWQGSTKVTALTTKLQTEFNPCGRRKGPTPVHCPDLCICKRSHANTNKCLRNEKEA